MAKYYQDFVGLNTFVYDPNFSGDPTNLEVHDFREEVTVITDGPDPTEYVVGIVTLLNTEGPFKSSDDDNHWGLSKYMNYKFVNANLGSFKVGANPDIFNALMIKRNGPYGYPSWRQIRVSENPIIRRQKKNNVFTMIVEPGDSREVSIPTGQLKLSDTKRLVDTKGPRSYINLSVEPVVTENYKPLELIGGINVYNEKTNEYEIKSVKLKTSFDNEMTFFSNDSNNRYYETIVKTDENYETLKELYLNGGLDDDSSPLEMFNLMTYKQTIWPKQQYSYLNRTRSRTFFVNKFWRDKRDNRTNVDQENVSGLTIPFQSMWPLDVQENWATRTMSTPVSVGGGPHEFYQYFIGGLMGSSASVGLTTNFGFQTGRTQLQSKFAPVTGGAGILMNSYAQFTRGFYLTGSSAENPARFVPNTGDTFEDMPEYLSSSVYYCKRHSLNRALSVVSPSGMTLNEISGLTTIPTSSLFEGLAAWDAGSQAGKNPFYDSYSEFSELIRLKGQDFSIIPEFRISSHVEEYLTKGVTEELSSIFEISGALRGYTRTDTDNDFYKTLSTSDFLKSFDLIKKDHEDFTKPSILTLKCKAIKKFLPYEGFYPAQRTAEIGTDFQNSIKKDVTVFSGSTQGTTSNDIGIQVVSEPLFAPGVLFNTIKSGVAVDYPIIVKADAPEYLEMNYEGFQLGKESGGAAAAASGAINHQLVGSARMPFNQSRSNNVLNSIWSTRIDFESLVEPERLLSNLEMTITEPHPFGIGRHEDFEISCKWGGQQKQSYKKKINNFLAEVAETFLESKNFTTISSAPEESPNFGVAKSGNYYAMRVKMFRSRNKSNYGYQSWSGSIVVPPQDLYHQGVYENFTMYSRPSAFGMNTWGTAMTADGGSTSPLDPLWGNNYCFTPPYYYGEAWCDLVFYANESKKYTLDEILSSSAQFPYYTRYWNPGAQDALRDLTGYHRTAGLNISGGVYQGYSSSPWKSLFNEDNQGAGVTAVNLRDPNPDASGYTAGDDDLTSLSGSSLNYIDGNVRISFWQGAGINEFESYPPHHAGLVNYNAMQLNSSVNIFGKGIIRERIDDSGQVLEVASSDTVRGKTRWIIQTKFETPMLNFNKYTNLNNDGCTMPNYAEESVPRGMWHQYGEIPEESEKGVFLQVTDIPESWLAGTLNVSRETYRNKVKSLANLCGFDQAPKRLGEIASVKKISEAVVAVPFVEQEGRRKFFTIPREDIDSCIDAARREVEPGRFVAGGPPKAGDTVYQMVKKMKKYVFPPSMDFVSYKEIQPFAMYVFEFEHNLTKQDLSDIWQNLPPEIGTSFQEAEASISHELLASELLGGGTVLKNGEMDENAIGEEIPSNIQWMVFKVKMRAKTDYFDKIVDKKQSATIETEKENKDTERPEITYNWPYDFFSLVELVKLDAEITFADIENDDKGNKAIKSIKGKPKKVSEGIEGARGKK